MHLDKVNNILALSCEDRYGYFIRKVTDFEEVWLIKDGEQYATFGDEKEQITIPVFPEEYFAELLLTDSWNSFSAEKISLDYFMNWLDKLQVEKIQIAGFPRPDFSSVVVAPIEMKNHLLIELDQYE